MFKLETYFFSYLYNFHTYLKRYGFLASNFFYFCNLNFCLTGYFFILVYLAFFTLSWLYLINTKHLVLIKCHNRKFRAIYKTNKNDKQY